MGSKYVILKRCKNRPRGPVAEGGPVGFSTGGTDGTGSPGGRGRFRYRYNITHREMCTRLKFRLTGRAIFFIHETEKRVPPGGRVLIKSFGQADADKEAHGHHSPPRQQ